MPARIVAIVTVVALAASAVVVAVAATTANGLPAYTNGYQKWPKLNRKPFTACGPLSRARGRQERLREQAQGRTASSRTAP